jgi:hypothetical protein
LDLDLDLLKNSFVTEINEMHKISEVPIPIVVKKLDKI